MFLRHIAEVTSSKCRKVMKRFKIHGGSKAILNFKSNKVLPEEIVTNENNSNREEFIRLSHLNASFIPSNSIECLAMDTRIPSFPVAEKRPPSLYENVTCQNSNCDSAYFSDGLEFIDSEMHEDCTGLNRNSHFCESSVSSQFDNSKNSWCTDKEKFENLWNETIESLVELS